jgi:hypothetical protein
MRRHILYPIRLDTLGNPTGDPKLAATVPHLHVEPFYSPADLIGFTKTTEVPKWNGTQWISSGEVRYNAQGAGQPIGPALDAWAASTHLPMQSPAFTEVHYAFNSAYKFPEATRIATEAGYALSMETMLKALEAKGGPMSAGK